MTCWGVGGGTAGEGIYYPQLPAQLWGAVSYDGDGVPHRGAGTFQKKGYLTPTSDLPALTGSPECSLELEGGLQHQ